MKINKGILISIEGIDGAGKSTLALNLADRLTAYLKSYGPHGPSVVLTKEPGATPIGKQLRTILQTQPVPLDPKTEFLLFAADRAQHFHEIIIPALQKKHIIISDRMADSSLVYQGYGRNLDISLLKIFNTWAMNGITPDIVCYVRVPYELAQQRLTQRNTQLSVFEKENTSFLQTLITGFDTVLLNNPNCIPIDGTQTPDNIAEITAKQIVTRLIKYECTGD